MAVKKIKLPKNHQVLSTSLIMLWVVASCIPGLIALTIFFGWGTLINIIWLSLWALVFETLVLILRKRNLSFYLKDYSALVTAVLLGLCIPPFSPWWLSITGIFFAIVIAKHLYGGIGHNLFNPAMVAYAVLLIAFPIEMTNWVIPLGVEKNIDASTGATALDLFRNERGGMLITEFLSQNSTFGTLSGIGWEWVNFGFLLGGLLLLYKRIISWQIPLAMLSSLVLMSALFYDGGSSISGGSPLMHLFGGGTMLGAFFIATDPVTASTTPRGRLIYGALIGIVTYTIRVWGAYPDGIAFAVLLGNFSAPFIDYYTQPRPSRDY
ncbi:MAG: RnfABCDGE type electron transport complex subunit D [Pseudohongiellaceae bacterium]